MFEMKDMTQSTSSVGDGTVAGLEARFPVIGPDQSCVGCVRESPCVDFTDCDKADSKDSPEIVEVTHSARPMSAKVRFRSAALKIWATVANVTHDLNKRDDNGDQDQADKPITQQHEDNECEESDEGRQKRKRMGDSKNPQLSTKNSYMKVTPWKTRLPPLPSVIGMHVFRRLYMAQLSGIHGSSKEQEPTQSSKTDEDVSDTSDSELEIHQESSTSTSSPRKTDSRIGADLSPEGQYATIRGYQDRIQQKLSTRLPAIGSTFSRLQTPKVSRIINSEGRTEVVKWRMHRCVQSAIDLADFLEESGENHLSDLRKSRLKPIESPLRTYRKWCRSWQHDFTCTMDEVQ